MANQLHLTRKYFEITLWRRIIYTMKPLHNEYMWTTLTLNYIRSYFNKKSNVTIKLINHRKLVANFAKTKR
jgi:hypothetical protein